MYLCICVSEQPQDGVYIKHTFFFFLGGEEKGGKRGKGKGKGEGGEKREKRKKKRRDTGLVLCGHSIFFCLNILNLYIYLYFCFGGEEGFKGFLYRYISVYI